jgi:hypothetical protein
MKAQAAKEGAPHGPVFAAAVRPLRSGGARDAAGLAS